MLRTCLLYACRTVLFALLLYGASLAAQQPPPPTDVSPLNGETYYLINQSDGLQADLNSGSTAAGDHILQQQRSFTSLSQRWALTQLTNGSWKISNIFNGLCLDASVSGQTTWSVQNPCAATATQQWSLNPTANGYYTVQNQGTALVLDVSSQPAAGAGAWLDQSSLSGAATQSQQWLLRPVFLRGVDNALLEKQEAARVSQGLTWWKDAGNPQDLLLMLRNHGLNTVRLRPTSMPPYATQPSSGPCIQNLCYAETDAQDLDLARRAKNLGLTIELTLLFDGGSSSSMPAAWANDSFAQLQTDLYNYVFQEIESYRSAGVMPDLVAIGNEVDTGFLNGNDPGASFANFSQLQITAMNAVRAAAADTSIGPAIPAPLLCIHITPAWNLTQLFTEANSNSIPYDAICQSYYPLYHGPLTAAQAAASNPGNKPVEQTVLNQAAGTINKPIFLIEVGEHYENGFGSNDPWYSPLTEAVQRQFLIDLDSVLRSVPNNLAMGMEYWDPAGVNIPNPAGGFLNGDNLPNAIYAWNGLTLFENADTSGTTNVNASNYSALLPGVDALGGKFDASLAYKLVNLSNGDILEAQQGSSAPGASLDTAADTGMATLYQQWLISSNGDRYFRIASLNPAQNGVPNVLDDSGGAKSAGSPVVQASASTSQEQEWDIVSAGNGYFNLVNRVSGLVLDLNASGLAVQQTQSASSQTQQWQIVPVHIGAAGAPSFLLAANPPSLTIVRGNNGSAVITFSPSGGYAATASLSCAGLPANATCTFSPSMVTLDGKDTVQTTALTITTQGASGVAPAPSTRLPDTSAPKILCILILFLLFALGITSSTDRVRRTVRLLALTVSLACILAFASCGGGSSVINPPPPPPPTPTPLGPALITVTANATATSGSGSANSSQSVAILIDVSQ
ncbi:MAG TPA: glycosyl hydrolase 53 family protein [Candidatus Acidoferrum sp.]|nr:glycosyl hydrolase 53 family protein [Candidatus Acidoferrum sp.]